MDWICKCGKKYYTTAELEKCECSNPPTAEDDVAVGKYRCECGYQITIMNTSPRPLCHTCGDATVMRRISSKPPPTPVTYKELWTNKDEIAIGNTAGVNCGLEKCEYFPIRVYTNPPTPVEDEVGFKVKRIVVDGKYINMVNHDDYIRLNAFTGDLMEEVKLLKIDVARLKYENQSLNDKLPPTPVEDDGMVNFYTYDEYREGMYSSPDGDYATKRDYLTLQAENERLRAVVGEIEQHIDASNGSTTDAYARFRTIGRIIKQAAEKAMGEE